ncbi:hypothetical protein AWH63_10520 [Marinobacter sp. C18]|nr:hypothetical protein AWH63_10520 [Marinobacter sp. C18]
MYNLVAQVAQDAKGNSVLLLRPFDTLENPGISEKRATMMQQRLDEIVKKVGTQRLGSRIMRGQINCLMGPMIDTPAKMAAFLQKLYPRANTMDLTAEQVRAFDFIREVAQKMAQSSKVAADTPFNLDALQNALPDPFDASQSGRTLYLYRDGDYQNPVYQGQLGNQDNLTNQDVHQEIRKGVEWLFQSWLFDGSEVIQNRLEAVESQLKAPDVNFWKQAVLNAEKDALISRQTEINDENARLAQDRPWSLKDMIELRDTLKARLDAQGRVVDGRLLQKVTDLNQQIDEIRMAEKSEGPTPEQDAQNKDNVQQNDSLFDDEQALENRDISVSVGVNFAGEELYEDGNGVRFKTRGNVRINEKVELASGAGGLKDSKDPRELDWMTIEEAVEAPYSGLSLAQRIRGQFFSTEDNQKVDGWAGLKIRHEDKNEHILARQGDGDDSESLKLVYMSAHALKHGEPVTLNAQVLRIMPDNRILNEGLPRETTDTTLKIWASLGLSLPQNAPEAAHERFSSAMVGASNQGQAQETPDDRDNETARSEDADSASDGASEALSADTSGVPTGVPAGGRSGGMPGSERDVAGRNSDDVSDALADGDESGQPAGIVNDQERVGGNAESRDGDAGDQSGADAHAEMAVRGSGGRGGNGGDAEPGTESAGTGSSGSDNPSVRATDGSDADLPGRADAAPEDTLAAQRADDRGAGRPGGPEAGVSDGTDGEPGESEATGAGAVSGAGGSAGSTAGQPTDDDSPSADSSANAESEAGSGTGADSSADADGVGSGASAGGDDWERFAEQQSSAESQGPEPLRGDHGLEVRTATQRLADNIAAIRLLKQLDDDGSEPTLEERQILGKFSGFGGIHPQMFQTYGNLPQWVIDGSKELVQMANDGHMEQSDLQSMKSTVLNAHYTHSGIIEPMWEALDRMGLPLERILEPSCGMLNFKAFMPASVESKVQSFTGIELDRYTARIAAKAHPDARVIGSGFEKTTFPDDFFDSVITNVPFGDYGMFDREHPERKTTIHNAFFLKGLDKVRAGGVTAFVTSSYVLDGKDEKVRKEIMDRAHVMGTYRLPTGTFDKSTGTEVVTDVIFLQKKGNFTPNYEPINILETRSVSAKLAANNIEYDGEEYNAGDTLKGFTINQAYVDNPDRVLGELAVVSSQFGPKLSVLGGGTIDEQREIIRGAFKSLPENVNDDERVTVTAEDIQEALSNRASEAIALKELPGALSVQNGQIYVRELNADGTTTDKPNTKIPKNMERRAAAAVSAMVALSDLLDAETEGEVDDAALDEQRAVTRQLFDEWEQLEKKTKAIFSKKAWTEINKDPRAQRMAFKETYDAESRDLQRPDILNGRTARPMNEQPTKAKDLTDALAISLAYTGVISETYMVSLLKEAEPEITVDAVREQLVERKLAYIDPVNGKTVEAGVYLSGNLAPKIEAARNVVESAPEFQVNLDDLEASLPAPLTASQIKVGPDAFWIPEDIMKAFLEDGLGMTVSGNWGVAPYFDDVQRHWRLKPTAAGGKPSIASIARNQEHVSQSRWGTKRANAFTLLDNLWTSTNPKVQDPIPGTEPTRYKLNVEETLKAQAKYDEIRDAFDRWIFKKPDRAQRMVDLYNEKFNTTVLYEPNGDHLVFPGMAESWIPRKHQSDFIWRAVSGKNSMTAHVVGAGKTLQLIGSAIRGKQMGRWKKPMVVVPNHMLEQFCNDAQDIYPNAKVLMMSAADARAANRPAFAAKAAMGDWDLIVCTHSVFEKVTVPNEFEALILEREIAKLRADLEDGEKQKTPKEVEKAIKKLEERFERTLDQINKGNENVLNMEQIGVDFVGIDEAHYYKNLMPDTARQIPGVSNASSKRAMNMLIKSQYLRELHGDCYGMMMATGTPISNSIVECYTFTRMLRPDLLEEAGILSFNDWMGLYGEIKHGMEMKPEGGGYQMKSRLSRFKNIPELVKMIRTFIDFKTREDLNLPSPEIIHEQVASDQSDFMGMFMKYIEARAKIVRNKDDAPGKAEQLATEIRSALNGANDKTLLKDAKDEVDEDDVGMVAKDILLTIATDGRKASLDPRLIHPKFEDNPNSKVNKAIRNMVRLYREYDDRKALQMVFCDFSSPTGKGIFNVYDDIKAKLIKAGIPEEEIAYIHDAKTDAEKEDIFAKCRSGEIRFILGSTQKMGVGTNVQERLVAMHELDPPWRPSDLDQRLGRMDRQGNSFDEAYSYRYVTVDSFDLFMWETLNRKLKMVNQALRRPEDCAREIDEEVEPGYEEILSITTGNPAIKEFMDTRQKVEKLKRMLDGHIDAQADIGSQIIGTEKKIQRMKENLEVLTEERDLVRANTPMALTIDHPVPKVCEGPMAVVGGLKCLGDALEEMINQAPRYRTTNIGKFGGLEVQVNRTGMSAALQVRRLDGSTASLYNINEHYEMYAGDDKDDEPTDHAYEAAKTLVRYVRKIGRNNGVEESIGVLEATKENLQALSDDHGKPFAYEDEFKAAKQRFEELAAEVGDEVNDNKELDPRPLMDFISAIHDETGAHHALKQQMKKIMDTSGAVVDVMENDEPDGDELDINMLDYDETIPENLNRVS